jgi:hypothetical protein
MKYFGIIFFVSLSLQVFSQSGKQYFGQAMIDTKDEKLLNEIQVRIRKNPSVKVVRIDPLSRQVFLITNELTSWSENDFMSIFGENSSKLNCLFIGVYGKDQIRKFPFKDCE